MSVPGVAGQQPVAGEGVDRSLKVEVAALTALCDQTESDASSTVCKSNRAYTRAWLPVVRRPVPPNALTLATMDPTFDLSLITDAVNTIATHSPDRLAVIDNGRKIGFAELDRSALQMAGWLHGQGVTGGDVLGITVRNDFRHLVSTLALFRLGCTQVTLASQDPSAMRAALAARCGVGAVLGDDSGDRIDGAALLTPDFETIFADSSLAGRARSATAAQSSLILTSSGTTGKPKLVRLNQWQIHGYHQLERTNQQLSFLYHGMQTNAGKWVTLASLARGHAAIYCDPQRTGLDEICIRFGATHVSAFPAKLEALVREHASSDGPAYQGVEFTTGGTIVSPWLRRQVQALLSNWLVVRYGATECGVAVQAGPEAHEVAPDCVGKPLPGVDLAIVDEGGAPVPTGQPGLIRVRSAYSATAYLDDEEATAKHFVDGWFQPGDLGRLRPDGLLEFIGRADDMMILNSINIFPVEIERSAQGFPGLRDCAAFPMRSSVWGDVPMLAVVADPGFDSAGLMAFCRQNLGTRAPRKIFVVNTLPRNAVGKVVRRELQSLLKKNDPKH